jgi:hypothetical protein
VRFGRRRWCSNPRFSITQSSGKIRPIDNGRASGASDATTYGEKLVLCNILHPAICAKLVSEEAPLCVSAPQRLDLEVGGEDLPDTYRHIPASPADHDVNIVAVKKPNGRVFFQIIFGLLFGHSGAVMSFNRWSKFLEAVARRVLSLMVALYYDDANIVDLKVAKGTGQRLIAAAAEMLGTPFAAAKRQVLSETADFLGMISNVGVAHCEQGVTLEPRPALVESIRDMCRQAL